MLNYNDVVRIYDPDDPRDNAAIDRLQQLADTLAARTGAATKLMNCYNADAKRSWTTILVRKHGQKAWTPCMTPETQGKIAFGDKQAAARATAEVVGSIDAPAGTQPARTIAAGQPVAFMNSSGTGIFLGRVKEIQATAASVWIHEPDAAVRKPLADLMPVLNPDFLEAGSKERDVRYHIDGLTFRQTCPATPEQYDVYDEDEEKIACARLRFGTFTVKCPDGEGETMYDASVPDYRAGCFADEKQRLLHLTRAARTIRNYYQEEEI